MKRKICIITGSRAEYGLLSRVMSGVQKHDSLKLQVIVTGMHLSKEFGLTYKEIENDGFKISKKIDILNNSDTSVAIAQSIGKGLAGFASAFDNLKPDLILVLGDRFEIFAAVSAALVFKIPVAHIHGGEKTEGAFDEALRHSITKMSHFHFVANNEYLYRVIQLGENPKTVFNVGGLGVDIIKNMKLLSRKELELSLNLKLSKRNLLVTFHPATLEEDSSENQFNELLKSLSKLKNTSLIFTYPNSDTNGRIIIKMINSFVKVQSNAHFFKSLGQLIYFSCINEFDGVIGNSSSGLLEVPSFKKGTINIGDRQKGRLHAKSIINCNPEINSISNALEILYSKSFKSILSLTTNPYGTGGSSEKIVELLSDFELDGITKKSFFDLPRKHI
jgi:GDP/UDP-N,N'-diacetylbacillosamine 2-epimerase (hydrolysing)